MIKALPFTDIQIYIGKNIDIFRYILVNIVISVHVTNQHNVLLYKKLLLNEKNYKKLDFYLSKRFLCFIIGFRLALSSFR